VQAKQLDEKLKRIEGHADEKARELGARIAYLESREAEAASELEAAEEEKYTLAADLEVVQEELEDANAHQKRYYEALMAKEEGLKKMKAQCGALQKAVAKLQYEADLQQTRAESAGIAEEADLSADYGHASSKKDQELKRLRQQLEAMQEDGVEDDDDLDQFGGGRRGGRMASAGAERAGGVDNYGEEQRRRRQEEEQSQARASLEADAKRLRAQQAALDDERKRMAQRAA
jgi:chromosome segregation ATPase